MVSNILAPDTLSFLGVKPTTNWLDYFFDRPRFSRFLREEPDENLLAIIADQFIEQALNGEKELGVMEKKQFDFSDDLVKMRHKIEELWMFSCACIASLNWNLQLFLEKSNVQRIRAVLRRLLKWAFKLPNQDFSEDPFPQVLFLGEENYSQSNVFAAWLYARFVMLVDTNGRFLTPVVKPTVSNPFNQVDQALKNAELNGQITVELRHQMAGAVQLLEKILALPFDSIIVPSFGCFLLGSDIIQEEKPLDLLLNVPTPRLELSSLHLERRWLTLKTNFDLMVAHFVARHFKAARDLCQKISNEKIHELPANLQKLLNIDLKQINGYKNSLRLSTAQPPSLSMRESLVSTTRARAKFDASLECLAFKKSLIVRRRLIIQLQNPEHQNELAEEIRNEIEKCKLPVMCQNLYSTAYFLSGFVNGFSEAIRRSLVSSFEKRGLNIPLRNLCLPSVSELPPLPPRNIIEGIITCGPPLWDIIASQNFHSIKQALLALGDQRVPFRLPHRYSVSDLLGEPLLSRIPQANYDQVAIFLGKMEQQCSNLNLAVWEDFINKFATDLTALLTNSPEFQVYFVLEAVRIKVDIWNRRLFRTEDDVPDALATQQLLEQIKKLMSPGSAAANFLLKFMLPIIACLVNLTEWPWIIQLEKNRPNSPYYIVALLLAHYMSAGSIERAQGLSRGWWEMLMPTFEDSSRRQTSGAQQMIISKRQFMEFVTLIKDSKSIDFILSYLITLYNFVLGPPTEGERIPVDRRLFHYNIEPWRNVPFNLTPEKLDRKYIEELFEVISKNALYVNPINAFWLRTFGDYYYVKEDFKYAARLYLESIIACTNGLTTKLFPDNVVDDLLWTKLIRCCGELRLPTIATILGQMRRDINPHLIQVESILAETFGSLDAGVEYFPLIGDMNLMEFMAAAYAKLNLNYQLEQLKKVVPTKALNPNNCYLIAQEEKDRRKMRFMRVLCSHFFDRNI